MKKTFAYIVAFLAIGLLKAQTIQNFTITPSNPTTTSNIRFITQVQFGSNVTGSNVAMVQNGNVFDLNRCYSLGALTVIDVRKDTLNIGLLPAGVYTVHYNGALTNSNSTCSPPGQTFTSSLTFTVLSTPSGIKENNSDLMQVSVYPNPFNDDVWISMQNNSNDFGIKVYDNLGTLVYEEESHFSSERIDLSSLTTGVYHITIIPKNAPSKRIIVIKL
jgi:hypothetical protein